LKLIYLMGAGHIGSTVIEVVLGGHPHLQSVGEVWKLPVAWVTGGERTCACGAPVQTCPFWQRVRSEWAGIVGSDAVARYTELRQHFEGSWAGWPRLLWKSRRSRSDFAEHVTKTEAFYEAIRRVGGKPVVVESSLTPRRAYALAMCPQIDLYLIHLVRDGRGVIWSLMNPAKRALVKKAFKPTPSWRTTRYWISANLQSAWVAGRVRPERRLFLRYEDFAQNPGAALERIGAWVGEDLSGLLSAEGATQEPAAVRHTVGGNRVRMQRHVQVRADLGWIEHLPGRDRRLFWAMAGWLARRYGYARTPS